MERFRHFHQNVGNGGVLRTAVLSVCALVFCIVYPTKVLTLPVVVGALLLPSVLQKPFSENQAFWVQIIQNIFYALFVLALLGPKIRSEFPDSEFFTVGLWGIISLYAGCYFWFWSTPDIVREKK